MAEPFAGGAIYRFLVVVAQESNRVAFNIAALGCSVPGSSPIGSHLKLILPITSLTVRSNATSPSLISAFAELPLIITAFLRCERGTECPFQDSRKPAGAGLVYRRRLAPANPRPKIRGTPDVGGGSPCRPPWCDQIPTPAENQLYPYLEHTCAHRHSRGFGKLFGESNHRKPAVVMSIIPLDFPRRCEQPWAARFARQAPEPSSQKSEHEKQVNSSARPRPAVHPQRPQLDRPL